MTLASLIVRAICVYGVSCNLNKSINLQIIQINVSMCNNKIISLVWTKLKEQNLNLLCNSFKVLLAVHIFSPGNHFRMQSEIRSEKFEIFSVG